MVSLFSRPHSTVWNVPKKNALQKTPREQQNTKYSKILEVQCAQSVHFPIKKKKQSADGDNTDDDANIAPPLQLHNETK